MERSDRRPLIFGAVFALAVVALLVWLVRASKRIVTLVE
jgi:hypothetical protein